MNGLGFGALNGSGAVERLVDDILAGASYEVMPLSGAFFGEVENCPELWATGATLSEASRQLRRVVETEVRARLASHQEGRPSRG